MLTLDARSGARLALEASDRVWVLERLRQEDLDGDELVEIEVSRGHDDTHAAGADLALEAILAGDDLAGLKGGTCRHGARSKVSLESCRRHGTVVRKARARSIRAHRPPRSRAGTSRHDPWRRIRSPSQRCRAEAITSVTLPRLEPLLKIGRRSAPLNRRASGHATSSSRRCRSQSARDRPDAAVPVARRWKLSVIPAP